MAESDGSPRIYVNVRVDEAEERRIIRQERAWTGRRLSVFCVIFLAICLTVLFFAAQTTSRTTWDDWFTPWPTSEPF
jgi:hypothetical protein